jgi:putative membrane protein
MLWVKSFHIIFVVAWFAGLLYLPRLFVYHCQCTGDGDSDERFKIMERKLFVIMSIGALGAALFGGWMLRWFAPALTGSVWLPAKLLLVVSLLGFHLWCWLLMRDFRANRNRHREGFYRLINEIPALILVVIVILVVVKPG